MPGNTKGEPSNKSTEVIKRSINAFRKQHRHSPK